MGNGNHARGVRRASGGCASSVEGCYETERRYRRHRRRDGRPCSSAVSVAGQAAQPPRARPRRQLPRPRRSSRRPRRRPVRRRSRTRPATSRSNRSRAGGRPTGTPSTSASGSPSTLTCSVVETTAVKVVPDLNQLEPTTVALQPFEVVKGVRHEDIRTPPLRYIQYEYTTRLIGDVFFGKDVDIPASRSRITSSPPSAAARRAAIRRMRCRPSRCGSTRSCRRKPRTSATTRTDTFAEIESRRVCGRSAELVASAIAFGFARRAGGPRARARRRPVSCPHAVGRAPAAARRGAARLPEERSRHREGRGARRLDDRAGRPRARGVPHRRRRRARPSRRAGNRRLARGAPATASWRCARACFRPQARAGLDGDDVRDDRAIAGERHERTPAQRANASAAERAARSRCTRSARRATAATASSTRRRSTPPSSTAPTR